MTCEGEPRSSGYGDLTPVCTRTLRARAAVRSSGRDPGVVGFKGQGPERGGCVHWQEEGYADSELD